MLEKSWLFSLFAVSVVLSASGVSAQTPSEADRTDSSVKSQAKEAGASRRSLALKGDDLVIAAPPEAEAASPGSQAPISLRFEQSPVTDVVNTIMGEILHANYVIHQPVGGTITLSTNTPIPAENAVMVLESALQANGVLMVKDARGTFHVGRPESLKGVVPLPRRLGNGPLPAGHGAVVIPLKFVGAQEMAEILKPVAPMEAFLRIDPLRNLLIMAGGRNQIEGWLGMVNTFDVNLLKGMSVGVFPLRHISTRDVDAAFKLMTSSAASPVASAAANTAAASGVAGQVPGMGALRLLPLEHINSVLIVTPRAELLDQAKEWIEKIDRPLASDSEPQLFVYKVQNGPAAQLASVLGGLFGGGGQSNAPRTQSTVAPGLATAIASTTASSNPFAVSGSTAGNQMTMPATSARTMSNTQTGGAQSFGFADGSNVKIMADERNNSIVVYGTAAEYKKIESSLRRLDVAQPQVLIEASIVEVTLTGDLQYGLQWFFNNSLSRPGSEWRGTGSLQFSSGTSSADGSSVFTPTSNGFSYKLLNPAGALQGLLNALAKDSLLKVISSPSLMVLDNQQASINVGSQVPVRSTTTTTANVGTVQSFEYKNTGVQLQVKPSVNAGDLVALDVTQLVTDVGSIDGVTGQRAFLQREIKTKVAVKSGEMIVLGGLISSNTTSGNSGVPILKDIPLLGALFSNTSSVKNKTELLVMITPRIVRSEIDATDVSAELRDRMKSLKGLEKEIGLSSFESSAGVFAIDKPVWPVLQ